MLKKKIYITRKIPDIGLNMLKEKFDIKVNEEDRVLTKKEIIENMDRCDGLLSLLTDTIDKEIIASNPNLKIISNYAVGYNNIDIDYASKNDIVVTNTPGVLTETTADMTWALLMAVSRRIVESDKFVRDKKYKGWAPKLLLGKDIYGKKLGIIGLGRIGRAVARRAEGFGMEVYYNKRSPLSDKEEKELNVTYYKLDELLERSDFITINALLNDETHHLIGKNEFKLMKNTAVIINTARGPIINESELVKALKKGEIAGAALDVFEDEPAVHPELLKMNNVVLTPHTASATTETRNKMAEIAAQNLIDFFAGNKVEHQVNL
ncbi:MULTISPECIES: D-glycerate dehydrogenase [unclassified Halanaerobium]|uniref:2-hydroxyacid dehydrogenase n=1 Tax=unclassified Halanaerobium TaxID=2641197 RepID=UPI000DF45C6D|nr:MULTISPECIES: D-glycerate dehydrogenase [unclassified Halanaerobium]RCW46348.1 glyoxylate reductase [Halanaerobium sp. MA284_MarDTE_T2]RCW82517.1 glyoxylate reductase [Halanaerobium sp. DL-01]